MKKILLIAASVLFMGVASLHAQNTPSTPSQSGQKQGTRGSEWSKVETSTLPSSVHQSLTDTKYKGWDKSDVYYNKTTNQYSVDVKSGSNTTSYNFDASGKVIQGNNTMSPSGTNPDGSTPGSTTPNSPRPNGNTPGSTPGTPTTPNP